MVKMTKKADISRTNNIKKPNETGNESIRDGGVIALPVLSNHLKGIKGAKQSVSLVDGNNNQSGKSKLRIPGLIMISFLSENPYPGIKSLLCNEHTRNRRKH
jgi:hypothetical protein